ncbi:MAG: voltage-gated potassium channel [Bacteroidia bacterium]|jgi:voltage-gated potassium channel
MILIRTIISFLKDKEYRDLVFTSLLVICVGTATYHYVEEWRWLDSLYFSVITLTTVGYGDFTPQTDAGKIFTMFYIVIGIGIILSFVEAVYLHFKPNTNARGNGMVGKIKNRKIDKE